MANPRNKNRKQSETNPDEENNVSDTATEATEPTTEAAEAPAPEAAAPAAAPAEPKVEVDHEGNLFDAIVAFSTDKDVAKLQGVYREVPSPSRGRVQGIAMKRAMQEAGFDMSILSEVLDAFNNLPAATKSTRTKPSVDEPTSQRIRLAGLMVAYAQLQQEFGPEAHAEASAWFESGAPEAHVQSILKVTSNVLTASAKSGRGGSGNRTSLSEKLPDLLARGAVQVGQVLQGANDAKATILDGGKVETDGQTFDNLSAAARHHRPAKDGSGKGTSTNGWDFWTTDGKTTVGSLRNS